MDGNDKICINLTKYTHRINGKNYFVPWLAVMPAEHAIIQALIFVDSAPPAGKIKFECSDPNVIVQRCDNSGTIINPQEINPPNILAYPTNPMNTSINVNNIELLKISFSSPITDHATIEARFYDDAKVNDPVTYPDFKGEVIGILNVFKNNATYKLDCYFERVSFFDSSIPRIAPSIIDSSIK